MTIARREVSLKWVGKSKLVFDKKFMKGVLRRAGSDVRKEARRLISRYALAQGPELPAYGGYAKLATGAMQRSARVKTGSGGGYVKVFHDMPAGAKDFYPAMLYYGVRRGAKRRRDHKAQPDLGRGWRIAPRKNHMTDALDNRRERVRDVINKAIRKGLGAK
ncbi:hypothetical protein [Jeongeupia sp. USM3]|uniref:hypothetical protein n=1 Tax=Jeongeupia sp. USM3 TaxID=1906741 RepID=UPI00089DFA96|nr:hypothetical protein [Jeongeupia sp. USM3]AOY00104.1 hypothetical protein BJP62_06350 [Jeongeupia sp. USM3]